MTGDYCHGRGMGLQSCHVFIPGVEGDKLEIGDSTSK